MKQGRPQIPVRAREVLSYFLRNPKAADNLEGVARWRAPQEAVRFSVDQVAHALSWLVLEGFLIEDEAPGVLPTYRLNPDRAADAEMFLAERARKLYVDPEGTPIEESRQMPPVVAWLDATLLRYLRENPPHAGDHPGLTRSPQSLEALLSGPLVESAPDGEAARRAGDESARTLAEACQTGNDEEPLAAVCHRLGLTWLEFQALLLCLAPEIDVKYQIAFGVLNDEMSRRAPTLGLICRILGNPLAVRAELAASGGLARWRLVESGAILPHADEPLRLDSTLVAWLLGDENGLLANPRLAGWLRLEPWPGGAWLSHETDLTETETLARRFLATEPPSRWLALYGEDPDGWRALAEATAKATNTPLIRFVAAGPSSADPQEWQEAAALITRAARLLNAPVVFDLAPAKADEGAAGRAARVFWALEEAGRPGIVIVPEVDRVLSLAAPGGWEVELRGAPSTAALADVYAKAAEDAGLHLSRLDAEQIAMAFPLPVSGIDSAVRLTLLEGAAERPKAEHAAALTAACRKVASPELPQFARRVRPSFGLEEVVLPPDRLRQLREMVAHVRYASRVLNTWGFSEKLPYGRGVAALFSGPSGTGKTMAAQAIAHELNTETYVVDLSRVISKYIGETEKFLDATFRDAQRAGAVLQIDEAEALFGKRSEIKDAHDRYANIEVAYLLQRMEAFDGCAILTTNLRQNLDQAFVRRLRFVIDFPKPDAAAREAIWRQCLPKGAPFRDIDIRFMARRLELTGGHIRQITLRAAFAAAAEESDTIEMRHLLAATRAELMKLGMPTAERDLAQFEAERDRVA